MFIDLSLPIKDGMLVYEGDPKMSLKKINSIEKDGFSNYELKTNMHVGTHIDGIGHMLDDPEYVFSIPLESLVGLSRLVKDALPFVDLGHELLLVDMKEDTLNEKFLKSILNSNVKLIVIEKASVDQYPYEIHKRLFKKGIRIVENAIGFDKLRDLKTFRLYVIPLSIEADSSLCRVFIETI